MCSGRPIRAGSAWHTELENQLADMIEEVDRCQARVEILAWDLELGGDEDGDEDEASSESPV